MAMFDIQERWINFRKRWAPKAEIAGKTYAVLKQGFSIDSKISRPYLEQLLQLAVVADEQKSQDLLYRSTLSSDILRQSVVLSDSHGPVFREPMTYVQFQDGDLGPGLYPTLETRIQHLDFYTEGRDKYSMAINEFLAANPTHLSQHEINSIRVHCIRPQIVDYRNIRPIGIMEVNLQDPSGEQKTKKVRTDFLLDYEYHLVRM